MRQCLAHFVSEFCLVDMRVRGGEEEATRYCVSVPAVNRLKSLAENGNIERYNYYYNYTTINYDVPVISICDTLGLGPR